MADIVPFKGILPSKVLADKIVAQSADNYTIEEAKNIIQKNQLSYLSVIYPDFIDNKKTAPNSIERYQKIYNRFQWFKQQSYLIQDSQPAYYIYKQKHPQFEFNGIIASISTDDYFNGNIKIHEQTLSEREKKLKEYLKHCKVNAEPVLFFYPEQKDIENILNTIQNNHANIEVEVNGIRYFIWKCFDLKLHQLLKKHFDDMGSVYIADGHHRSASSALLAKEWQNNKNARYFLGAFFSENNLKNFSFHRLLKNIIIPDDFINRISDDFDIEEIKESDYHLKNKIIGMYWDNRRFLLTFKNKNNSDIDTEILYEYVLKKIFLLQDIRNNTSVHYYPAYTYSIEEAENMVDSKKFQLAFFTQPVSVNKIKRMALENKIMPPKSTYVLPKLLNALVIYSLENSMV